MVISSSTKLRTEKLIKKAASEKNLAIKKLLRDEITFYANIPSHISIVKPIAINRSLSFAEKGEHKQKSEL